MHAGVMAYPVMADGVETQAQPCHAWAHTSSSDHKKNTGDCFEQCMWVYSEVWWVISITPIDFLTLSQYVHPVEQFVCILKRQQTSSFYSIDPPPIPLVWYAEVWKEVQKRE